MRRHVQIRTQGTHSQVLIDGHDIARAVTGLTFKASVDQSVATLQLDLQLVDVTEIGSVDTEVVLGEAVADTLIALGWTPPKEDS
ncbi:hypothetical protein [Actinacidiphila glaucinigra]|uniref:hypothetical protein n=1 Tax=Actinacidiphila glaucinigra TaxID=235986 RepID=UPI0035D9124A